MTGNADLRIFAFHANLSLKTTSMNAGLPRKVLGSSIFSREYPKLWALLLILVEKPLATKSLQLQANPILPREGAQHRAPSSPNT